MGIPIKIIVKLAKKSCLGGLEEIRKKVVVTVTS